MVKPNYAFAKRQRDIAKKKKKEAKRQKKTETTDDQPQLNQRPPIDEEKTED